jgi:hypothetical protein
MNFDICIWKNSEELLTYLEPDQQPSGWAHLEKYFFR